jgi:hypothetical protein
MGHIEAEVADGIALDQSSGVGIYEQRVMLTLAGGWESGEATEVVVGVTGELYCGQGRCWIVVGMV